MKHRFIVIIIMLFTVNSIFSQDEIKGFLGVQFGQGDATVIDILKKSFPNTKWDYPYFEVNNVSFIGITFNNLTIKFKQSKLSEGTFLLSDSKLAMTSNPFDSSAKIQTEVTNNQNTITQKFTQIFTNLYDIYSSKYGQPSSATPGNIIWRDKNSNSITLNSTIENGSDEMAIRCTGRVTITYRNGTNDEF